MTDKKNQLVIILITTALVAFFARLGYVLWLKATIGLEQFSDFQYLYQLAVSLSEGKGFTLNGVHVWNQSYGYPFLLSLFFRVFGPSVGVALAVNILLGTITSVLVALLSYLLLNDSCLPVHQHTLLPPLTSHAPRFTSLVSRSTSHIILLTGLLAAFFPDLLLYSGLCAAENLMLPLVVAMACAAVYYWRRDWLGGLAVGALAALAASAKALMLFVVPALVLFWIFTRRRWIVMTLWAVVAAAIVLTPRTIANYRLCGKLVPFAAVSGETFLDGNNPQARGVPSGITTLPEIEKRNLHPVDRDRLKMHYALDFIKHNPVQYLKLEVLKLVRMVVPVRDFVFEANGRYRFFGKLGSRYLPTLFNMFLYAGIFMTLLFSIPAILPGRNQRTSARIHPPHCEAKGWTHQHTIPALLTSYFLRLTDLTAFTGFTAAMMIVIQLIFFAYSRYRLPFLVLLLPAVATAVVEISVIIGRRPGRKGNEATGRGKREVERGM